MARFSPDHDIVDSMIHVVYRYNTHEVDDDGFYIYRPISFQNDLEDITFTYGNMTLTSFDPTDETSARAAFNNVIRAHDNNVTSEVTAGTMDAFQMMQHVADFLHVGAPLLPNKFDLPKAANANTAGLVKLYGIAGTNEDGTMTQKAIGTVYATKEEIPSVWDANGKLVSPTGNWSLWVDDASSNNS